MMLLLVLTIAVANAQMCPVFNTQDPATGTSYSYDYGSYALPSTAPKTQMVQGKEGTQAWTIYLNVCGNAGPATGCTVATPACQDDSTGNFFSIGTPNSWTARPYYDPTKGPGSAPLYGQGIAVTIGGGDVCGNNVARNAFLFLQCNPSVVARPNAPIPVTEYDPSDPEKKPTVCTYYFAPFQSATFCPGGPGNNGGPGAPDTFDMGWVFVIIVLVGLFLYFVIGILILKFAQHKEGREIVPHVDFWTSLPLLVWDGMKWTFCCVPCKGGGSYTEV